MSRARTIQVNYLARVEGEGSLTVKLKGDKATEVRLGICPRWPRNPPRQRSRRGIYRAPAGKELETLLPELRWGDGEVLAVGVGKSVFPWPGRRRVDRDGPLAPSARASQDPSARGALLDRGRDAARGDSAWPPPRVPAHQLSAARAIENPLPRTPTAIEEDRRLYHGKGFLRLLPWNRGPGDHRRRPQAPQGCPADRLHRQGR